MAAAKQKEVTTRRVDSIQFGMYTDDEVRAAPLPLPTVAAAWQQSACAGVLDGCNQRPSSRLAASEMQ